MLTLDDAFAVIDGGLSTIHANRQTHLTFQEAVGLIRAHVTAQREDIARLESVRDALAAELAALKGETADGQDNKDTSNDHQ